MTDLVQESSDLTALTTGSASPPVLTDPTRGNTPQIAFEAAFGPYGWTVLISLTLLFFALLFLVRLAYVSERYNDGFLAILVGFLLGWAGGMFFSPYSTSEKSNFVSISQAVSAFVSGYMLSKLDRFLESSLFVAKGPVAATWTLLSFFAVAFLIFSLGTYSCRRYFLPAGRGDAPEQPQADASVSTVTTTTTKQMIEPITA